MTAEVTLWVRILVGFLGLCLMWVWGYWAGRSRLL